MMKKRTYTNRAEYMKKAVSKRRRKIKEMLIKYKGGKCIICGYKKYSGALDLHHIDGSTKKFGLGANGLTRSWRKVKMKPINAFLFAPIVTGKYMAVLRSFPPQGGSQNKVNCWKPHLRHNVAEGNQQPSPERW